jgi:hypothetical protein
MAAIFTSTVSELAEKCPLKRLDSHHTRSIIREQAPMLPEGGTLRVQRKRGKVTLSKGADWKNDTTINKVRVEGWQKWRKLTWQSATNNEHENERRGKKEEGTRAREMLDE